MENKNNQNELTNQNEIEIQRSKIKQSFLHFGTLYRVRSFKKQIIYTIIIGVLFGIVQHLLISITGLYNMGLDGLCQSIARIVRHFLRWTSLVWKDSDKLIESFWVLVIYNVLFWLLILVANIPLFVLAYKKISKKFGFLSIIFLVVACITGFCIGLIPTSEQWFMISKIDSANLTWETGKFKDFSIFLYAILWAFLQGVFASALLIIGCCTGGADILGVYWSHKKFKDIGASFILVHLLFLFACNLIGSYIPFAVEDPIAASFSKRPGNRYELENFFNPSFVAGFIMIVVNGIVLNVLFPKFKMVKVEIISN